MADSKHGFESRWGHHSEIAGVFAPEFKCNSPDGPTVLINQDSPILLEMVRYHQQQYPDIYAEEVQKTVFETFGEIAACKVAHSQKLSRNVPREVLERLYRSEEALAVALMGLLAEEAGDRAAPREAREEEAGRV